MKNIKINERLFDYIATFVITASIGITNPAFRLTSTVFENLKDYSSRRGILVDDYKLEDNLIIFSLWNYTKNTFEEVISLPVDSFYFSPSEGTFLIKGVFKGNPYDCTIKIVNNRI